MSVVLLGSTSGSITLQEPAVAGTNTVNFGANTGVAILDANTPAFRNRIINGAMVIDQRNAGASITPSVGFNTYTLDRWNATYSVGSKFSVEQTISGVAAPVGFTDYLGVTSLSAYSVPSGQAYSIVQCIEGFNTADLQWGTANAATVTLSFWVRSSLTGTFGGAIKNSADNRSYPFSYTISAANTWEQKSTTIAGDTSGTWVGATNGIGLQLLFGLGVGSTYSGTAGAWAASNFYSATGATSVVGTNGATFYITGVQLEKGSTATSFDYRSYGTELAMCYRYFYKTGGDVNGAYTIYSGYTAGIFGNTYFHPVVMRASPTVSVSGTFTVSNCNQPTFLPFANDNMLVYSSAIGTGSAYFAGGASVSVSAEL